MAESDAPLFLTALPAPEKGSGPAPAGQGLFPARAGELRPAAFLGVPLDRTTSYRNGTGSGPAEIRSASWSLETYSPALDGDLCEQRFYDYGDLELDRSRAIEADLEAAETATAAIVRAGFLPVILGGEHLLTLATYRGVLRGLGLLESGVGYPGLEAVRARAQAAAAAEPSAPVTGESPVFLHFDAHADMRLEFGGLALSHATIVRHVSELCGPRNVYQFGIRSGEREEMRWARANVNHIPGTLLGATREALRLVAGRQVYCSVDIDIFDPAHAPGTGSPEPGGPPAQEVFQSVVAVGVAASLGASGGGIDLVGFDLVEVSPPLDPSGRTNVLAAKLLREFLIARGA